MNKEVQQKYEGLLSKLEENQHWPLHYMFKCIVPNEDNKVKQVSEILAAYGKVSFRHTENLKYVAVTCKAWMRSAKRIVILTQHLNEIDGTIVL